MSSTRHGRFSTDRPKLLATIMISWCDDCICHQEICRYTELSLLRGTTAFRMQCMVLDFLLLHQECHSQLLISQVCLQPEDTVTLMTAGLVRPHNQSWVWLVIVPQSIHCAKQSFLSSRCVLSLCCKKCRWVVQNSSKDSDNCKLVYVHITCLGHGQRF